MLKVNHLAGAGIANLLPLIALLSDLIMHGIKENCEAGWAMG